MQPVPKDFCLVPSFKELISRDFELQPFVTMFANTFISGTGYKDIDFYSLLQPVIKDFCMHAQNT